MLEPGYSLTETDADILYRAARLFNAERTATGFLSRAEHSRFMLNMKLAKKGFARSEYESALDYLEEQHILDDKRFAEAWLRNRLIHHSEGRQKLLAGLLTRGISKADAAIALDSLLQDITEEELCLRAVTKLKKQGKTGNRLIYALSRRGFSQKIIRMYLHEEKK